MSGPRGNRIDEDYLAAGCRVYANEWDGHDNVFWTGEDGRVYWSRYGGTEWTGAKALAGEGAYADAPYPIGYDGDYYADGPSSSAYTGENGYLHYKEYKAGEPAEEEGGYQASIIDPVRVPYRRL